MKNARRSRLPRPGRHLPAQAALPIIECLPDILEDHETRLQRGFKLKETCRPYRRTDGGITITFVWRRRRDGWSCQDSVTVRLLPDELQAV